MVERITMRKSNNLGWAGTDELELLGRAWGLDIYTDRVEPSFQTIYVYDRARRRVAASNDWTTGVGYYEYRVAARLELSRVGSAWGVDLMQIDSRYKGQNLSIRLYRWLLRRLDITLQAGDSQSAGGRWVWNRLARTPGVVVYARKSPRSRVIDFPTPGARELLSKCFDLYDTQASLYAVASGPSD